MLFKCGGFTCMVLDNIFSILASFVVKLLYRNKGRPMEYSTTKNGSTSVRWYAERIINHLSCSLYAGKL